MRIAIAGGHGQVARHLSRALSARGDVPVALVRQLAHVEDVQADGAEPVVLDLERANARDVAEAVSGADAVVFAAGAGPGSGAERKDTVDRAAAGLLADGAAQAGVRRYVLISSMGVDGEPPAGTDGVFATYLRAKAASEADLRERDLDWTVVRPGRLTDDEPTGTVRLDTSVPRGAVPRADVAAVLAAVLHRPDTAGLVLELTSGVVPVEAAVAAVVEPAD
ncbi:NAD-dependent dehydratase [Cellulomonas chitinilytica]|uniref:NAD-dependent dehydratase n=1 Tax=Cellulomonas chitinilytica TaxID=398759 RepID=A0A919U298_9CELL|nr:NAD(P)-binding oxidoreductase [Cellulomonas chitinilytica]GIG21247.1 NAD-dependent dehydratase [Cellulomonas chitinilytica]